MSGKPKPAPPEEGRAAKLSRYRESEVPEFSDLDISRILVFRVSDESPGVIWTDDEDCDRNRDQYGEGEGGRDRRKSTTFTDAIYSFRKPKPHVTNSFLHDNINTNTKADLQSTHDSTITTNNDSNTNLINSNNITNSNSNFKSNNSNSNHNTKTSKQNNQSSKFLPKRLIDVKNSSYSSSSTSSLKARHLNRLSNVAEYSSSKDEYQSPFVEKIRQDFKVQPKTPKKRVPSVKISLTPAQRVEKRKQVKLENALEDFKFGPLVGKGAFSCVYKGVNKLTNQVVAIKQITLDPNSGDVQVLMGEIDLLKILKHPNIVKYHGFVKTANLLNVFLEYCSGGSLRQYYKKLGTGLPEPQIISYVKLILLGLEYLHEQGVVHRDVKSANVLLTETNTIKLADFGVATQISTTNEYALVVGTPNWMAPETVLGGEGICTALDIWSLGATIIELFTTHPPYHELNAMATLHAIGTDDHPPLPKGILQLALSFLMECFQKDPNLRKSAKLLLKHKWIESGGSTALSKKQPLKLETERCLSVKSSNSNIPLSIKSYTEDNNDNWDEIPINQSEFLEKIKKLSQQSPSITKVDLLRKFRDGKNEDEDNFDDFGNIDGLLLNQEEVSFINGPQNNEEDDIEEDPFADLSVNSFDTGELESQSKLELLFQKFSRRVDNCNQENEEVWDQMTRISGKMLHIIKKYPDLYVVLVREHGIMTVLDLLEKSQENPNHEKLWIHCLAILIYVFQSSSIQLENFCLLGGIPVFISFTTLSYSIQIRRQVVKFVRCMLQLERSLSMFVLLGGLKLILKFAEEDYDTEPEFPLIAIEVVYTLLSREGLARLKSDLCRILAKYGVVFWFAVILNRLTKEKDRIGYCKQIVHIFGYFGLLEPRARSSIATIDLFKLLIRIYRRMGSMDQDMLELQLVILKFFKSMLCVLDILRKLYSAGILEFIAQILSQHNPSTPHYKETVNIICPIMYNCCYLNHGKEIELVELGALPNLRALLKINLSFRQFVLPVLCELVYCDTNVRQALYKFEILEVFLALVIDPYWQLNALDLIWHWFQQNDLKKPNFENEEVADCLVSGFLIPVTLNMESALDTYLKFISHLNYLRNKMDQDLVMSAIDDKLQSQVNNPVILLKLLRILKVFVDQSSSISDKVCNRLVLLKTKTKSILVQELINEILKKVLTE